ncbi:MAG: hypothetical protein R2705_07245 [Ilumatobacteraceae bacterium]
MPAAVVLPWWPRAMIVVPLRRSRSALPTEGDRRHAVASRPPSRHERRPPGRSRVAFRRRGIADGVSGGAQQDGNGAVIVVRLPVEQLSRRTIDGGAVDGIVAYSKICTHAGCAVGLFRRPTRAVPTSSIGCCARVTSPVRSCRWLGPSPDRHARWLNSR